MIENKRTKKQFQLALELAPVAIVMVNNKSKIIFVNICAETMFGYAHCELISQSVNILLPEKFRDDHLKREREFYADPKARPMGAGRDLKARRKDGAEFPVEIGLNAIAMGKEMFVVCTIVDITIRKQLEEHLKQTAEILRGLSLIDELTGLYNRRGFMVLSNLQMKLNVRNRNKMVLFFMDLDKFKLVNDAFGHLEGDQVLIKTAGIITKTFRAPDIVARLGGDEFIVLASDTSNDTVKKITDRLKTNLKNMNTQKNMQCKISLTIGNAQWDPKRPATIEELLEKADKSMYAHKPK